MATKIEAAELLTRQAGDSFKDAGQKCTKQAAMAKYYASEVSVQVSTDAVQVHGGYGYTKDFPVEKFYRDSKLVHHRGRNFRGAKTGDRQGSHEIDFS
jgi:alkylation response protein AidB-like acyl-CoA dehydrogenase